MKRRGDIKDPWERREHPEWFIKRTPPDTTAAITARPPQTARMLTTRTYHLAEGVENEVRRIKRRNLVVKVPLNYRPDPPRVARELTMFKAMGRLAPKTWFDPKHQVFVQKMVRGERASKHYSGGHSEFEKVADAIIGRLYKRGIRARDLHSWNIMIDKKTGKPVVVDIGYFQWRSGYPMGKYAHIQRSYEKRLRRRMGR
jgi:hypothetical protein